MTNQNGRPLVNFFAQLSLMSQNLNSFNLTDISELKLNKKISALLRNKSDIIFVSDIRAGPRLKKLEKKLLYNDDPYLLYANSTGNKRGVGILIRKELNCQVNATYKDRDENLLGLNITINNESALLVSCYGENEDKGDNFFNTLQGFIHRANSNYIILGGDFNTVIDPTRITGPTDIQNLDLIQMRSNINPKNSALLNNFLRDNNLVDPFRIKNPLKREYSYVPFSQNNKNRSRIDYFFVTANLLSKAIVTYDYKLGTAFDHKPVMLNFGGKTQRGNKIIDPNLLNSKTIKDTAKLAAYNTYLTYLPPNQQWENTMNTLNTINVRNYTIMSQLYNPETLGENTIDDLNLELSANIESFDHHISLLPDIANLDLNYISIDRDMFLTILLNNISNEVISAQSEIRKLSLCEKKLLSEKLTALKTNYTEHFDEILEKERLITNIIETEINEKLKHNDKFYNLRFEKNSAHFNRIFRASKAGGNIELIKCKEGGIFTDFSNNDARNDYIKSFYGKIYQSQNLPNISIEDFLGEDILNNHEVQGKKLTENRKQLLDRPLTLQELEESLNSANFNSAPGIDGLSNRTLKAFWPLIKNALLNGFMGMIEKGSLTPLLKLGGIRLIPKKGELSDIANWRPISLLSVVYKLFSGLLTKRLEPYIDTIASKTQKGYSRTKRIHDSIVNILDLMNICSKDNINLVTIAIDFSKAFDSVHEPFIFKCLDFLNFGPFFKKMVKVCLNGRMGCIITQNGYTPSFPLEQGVPQGDRLSPYLFILCIEILIIKITYTATLSIPNLNNLPKPNKLEGFADDITVNLTASSQNLILLNQILSNFRSLSGLRVNNDKTKIIITSNNPEIIEEIEVAAGELGFKVVEEMEILGFTFFKDTNKATNNWNKVVDKITNKIHNWKIFNLSLQGRVVVAKSHLLSTIQYIGTVLPISNEVEERITSLIENYVQGGGKKIAKNKLYAPVSEGGLNLIRIRPFLNALKAGLVKHMSRFSDWWADILLLKAANNNLSNMDNINPDNVSNINTPIIYNIAEAWRAATNAFYLRGGNIRRTKIVNNPLVNPQGATISRLGNRGTWEQNRDRLTDCIINDLFQPGTTQAASRDTLNTTLGIDLNLLEYMEIRRLTDFIINKYRNSLNKRCEDFSNFMYRPEKGSRKIRMLLQDDHIDIKHHNFTTYYRTLLGIPDIENVTKIVLQLWKVSYISFELSQFIFNYTQNSIHTRDRLSHFKDIQDTCPLCISTNSTPRCRDSMLHAFSECNSVNKLWDYYFNRVNLVVDPANLRQVRLVGYIGRNDLISIIINLDLFLVRYFIQKIRNLDLKIINQGSLHQFLVQNRQQFYSTSSKYRKGIEAMRTLTAVKLEH